MLKNLYIIINIQRYIDRDRRLIGFKFVNIRANNIQKLTKHRSSYMMSIKSALDSLDYSFATTERFYAEIEDTKEYGRLIVVDCSKKIE